MITTATAAEFDEICSLNVAAYREFAADMSPEGWSAMEASLKTVASRASYVKFLVVKERGAIVGSIGYCPAGKADAQIYDPTCAAIHLLAVAPEHRGRGIARELLLACIDHARDDGADALGLFTSELMHSAQSLYETLGFERRHELPRKNGLQYWLYTLKI